jgi:hypothetical protein
MDHRKCEQGWNKKESGQVWKREGSGEWGCANVQLPRHLVVLADTKGSGYLDSWEWNRKGWVGAAIMCGGNGCVVWTLESAGSSVPNCNTYWAYGLLGKDIVLPVCMHQIWRKGSLLYIPRLSCKYPQHRMKIQAYYPRELGWLPRFFRRCQWNQNDSENTHVTLRGTPHVWLVQENWVDHGSGRYSRWTMVLLIWPNRDVFAPVAQVPLTSSTISSYSSSCFLLQNGLAFLWLLGCGLYSIYVHYWLKEVLLTVRYLSHTSSSAVMIFFTLFQPNPESPLSSLTISYSCLSYIVEV